MTAVAALQASVFGTDSATPPTLRLVLPPTPPAPTQLNLKLALPIARALASRLLRLGSIRGDDFEDVVQELLAEAVARWCRFDPHRAGASTFISMVMSSRACSLSRSRYAAKRGGERRSMPEKQALLAQAPDFHSCDRCSSELDRAVVRQDVRAVVAGLPLPLQRLCGVLMGGGVSAAARALGLPRHVVRAQIDEIRQRFISAGLERGDA